MTQHRFQDDADRHRQPRDQREQHQHHRGRDQDAEARSRLDHPRDHQPVIAAPHEFRQGDGGADRHAGDREPVHHRDHHHQQDRSDRKPAGQGAEPDMKHPVEVFGQPALAHHVTHEDEHRQRQQRRPFHQLHHSRKAHVGSARPPKGQRRDDGDEADRAEHPLPGDHHQQHRREHQDRDGVVIHQIFSPRRVATSRIRIDTACSSISAKDRVMITLIGQSTGRQAVGLRSPTSKE
ncbi:hypothetical protein SDC9_105568 [bioreactor metagenome]|uniref:Uncharacterized protein n=1 Tax=bioreactor metagenome TaxID=1076179 RepID=A0A645AZT9_9ZZZZ